LYTLRLFDTLVNTIVVNAIIEIEFGPSVLNAYIDSSQQTSENLKVLTINDNKVCGVHVYLVCHSLTNNYGINRSALDHVYCA
jgi:hypothetical protein